MWTKFLCSVSRLMEKELFGDPSMNGGTTTPTKSTISTVKEIKNFAQLASSFRSIMEYVVGPVLIVIGTVLVIYMISLGVQFAKAEDAEARNKVKGRLVATGIGAVIIIAGIVLCFAIDWMAVYYDVGKQKHIAFDADNDNFCDFCGAKNDAAWHGTN